MTTLSSQARPVQWLAIPQPTRVALDGDKWRPASARLVTDASSESEGDRLQAELDPFLAIVNSVSASTISLRVDPDMDAEAFHLDVHDDISVVAGSTEGVFRATRQLLHNLRAQGGVPRGRVQSLPQVRERGFHLDAARKYYSPDWVCDLITALADVSVNRFQWHFSEHEGLRLDAASSGLLSTEGSIGREDARRIVEHARDSHVQIVPSLDMPGHLGAALRLRPELQLRVDSEDRGDKLALDITRPEAFDFAVRVVDDYLELFPESTHWNLGADEFVDFAKMENYPELEAQAQDRIATDATGFDLLTEFVNRMAGHLRERGKTVRVWNDGMMRAKHVDLDPRVEVCWWTNWHREMRPVTEHLASGHRVINFNDSLFYYVLGEKAGYTYPTSERIWEVDWHPGVFSVRPDRPEALDPPYPSGVVGSYFSVWSDDPAAQSQDEVAERVALPVAAMAERAWNAGSRLRHDEFAVLHAKISARAARD